MAFWAGLLGGIVGGVIGAEMASSDLHMACPECDTVVNWGTPYVGEEVACYRCRAVYRVESIEPSGVELTLLGHL